MELSAETKRLFRLAFRLIDTEEKFYRNSIEVGCPIGRQRDITIPNESPVSVYTTKQSFNYEWMRDTMATVL